MRNVGYRWHLRALMAERGMFATSDLVPLLAERGVDMSSSQVFRMVTGTPERLSCHVLAALTDALDCTVGDLFEPYVIASTAKARQSATGHAREDQRVAPRDLRRPARARVVDE
jgi:DNA-binding Xre family transcriptional regulator